MIERVELKALRESLNCLFEVLSLVAISTFFLQFVHLRKIPPGSLVVNIIRVLIQSFPYVLLAHL